MKRRSECCGWLRAAVRVSIVIAGLNLVLSSISILGIASQALAATPIGWLDGIDANGTAGGWALDPDSPSTSIAVHFYVDGPAGTGVFAGAVTANIPRPDVNQATGYPGDHGFTFSIPPQFKDGRTHTLYVHGIDTSGDGSQNVLLSGVPQSFAFSSTPSSQSPIGWLDRIDGSGVASGWALDPDSPSTSIAVHFYVDGPAGTGVFAGAVTANIPRPDVNEATGYPGDHGFSFSIPAQFRDGRLHQLYVHGIDTSGDGTQNVLLSGVPQNFVLGGTTQSSYIKMVDASANGFGYAYAPAIIVKNGIYHVFFCSNSDGRGAWDFIRYTRSTDGKNWTAPVIVLRATATNGMDLAACDPSVVFYQGFYYLFYSSAYETAPGVFQTVVQVARSTAIDGPYLTYTRRGTWGETPTDPKIIIEPLVKRTQNPSGYGAGQQSVIVRGGELVLWYTDDSIDTSVGRTYMLTSTDPVQWIPDASRAINLTNMASVDVKYDPNSGRFAMFSVINQHSSFSYLGVTFSLDGLTWEPITTIREASIFPDYAHNVGAGSNELGTLLAGQTLVGFGAPWDLRSNDVWGEWDLFGILVDIGG